MPKRVDPVERRQTIANAAVESIAADGLDGTKLSRIARIAGVTTGAVTHYFEDKDEVLLAALEEVCGRLLAKMNDDDDRPALAQLADALPIGEQAQKEWRVWLAFWGRAAFVPTLARVHRSYYETIETNLARMIGGDQTEARDTACAIIAAIDGIGARVSLEPELWTPERQNTVLARLLSPLLESKGADHAPAQAPAV
jgi:TetR/AcrR family transcriptional regulator, transcriptional repressor of bet genes